jgi:hypothetical protein
MKYLSEHASARAKQRAVPPLIQEWLCLYGAEAHDNRGCIVRYFDKPAKRRLERAVGREPVKRMKDKLTCYLVEGDGRVITTGHRRRRIRRA